MWELRTLRVRWCSHSPLLAGFPSEWGAWDQFLHYSVVVKNQSHFIVFSFSLR